MSERETVTAKAWQTCHGGKNFYRDGFSTGLSLAAVGPTGWTAWFTDATGYLWPDASGPETGQAGRDAADAALRAAGVVLL